MAISISYPDSERPKLLATMTKKNATGIRELGCKNEERYLINVFIFNHILSFWGLTILDLKAVSEYNTRGRGRGAGVGGGKS